MMSFPIAEILNRHIHVKLYLPDQNKGYYRATRFDWSGVIYELEYNGHQYFGEWFDKHDPQKHDAICGPVDEFTQIGYDEAPMGGEFLKIGIGTLYKPLEVDYQRFGSYEIANAGKWNIVQKSNSITFRHFLDSIAYSYLYTKVVKLSEKDASLSLVYTIENKGKHSLSTCVYNHNFFTIDRQATGPDIVIGFSFNPKGTWRDADCPALIKDNQIRYARRLNKGESVYMENMFGFNPQKNGYQLTIENHQSKAGVRIIGNRKLFRSVFWASSTTSCPEPYIQINIKPNEKFSWKNDYVFYEF